MTDSLEIAQSAELRPVADVAADVDLLEAEVEPRGRHVAKVDPASVLERLSDRRDGKLVVVTGITPTSAGEGKTTTSIGLTQGLARMGTRALLCLREPSMGPVFGSKGGGTGGGRAQVMPMEEINLHFTGDFHAVAAAHNLLAAQVDAALHHGTLDADPRAMTWTRTLDMNDRALRNLVIGLGGRAHGVPRESGFVITAASEVMASLAMATDTGDLRNRLGRIEVGVYRDGRPVTAEDLRAAGAMAVLLRDAVRPNLVQTLEGQPVLIHTGPFGNIASGNNSIIADRVALKLSDLVVTEAGFGSDLGFEKFCHLVATTGGLTPSAAVIVATARALKMHGGLSEAEASGGEDTAALERGAQNLAAHVDNVHGFGLPAVIAVNRVPGDTDRELQLLSDLALDFGAEHCAVTTGFQRGGEGAEELAKAVLAAAGDQSRTFRPINEAGRGIRDQVEAIATRVYGGDGAVFSPSAERTLLDLEERGLGSLPVCMAKTHLSTSHDPALKGRPRGFTLPVRELVPSVGAGFVVVLCGDVMRMPGLGREPALTRMDLEDGRITGLS